MARKLHSQARCASMKERRLTKSPDSLSSDEGWRGEFGGGAKRSFLPTSRIHP